ncbi:hypothetical protein AA042_16890 [Pseudomonas lundensis]|nr:hypothetical protein AA042_16890 [Pseudomonas lundensis]
MRRLWALIAALGGDYKFCLLRCINERAGLYCRAFFVPVMRARCIPAKMFTTDRTTQVANTLLNVPVL